MAMEKSGIELDFFHKEKPPIFERRRSFRDIQGVISRMDPEVVKSVIGVGKKSSVSVPSTPKETDRTALLPAVCDPTLRLNCGYEKYNDDVETAPMTIFYNGLVAVFDVSPRKAQDILRVAEEERVPKLSEHSGSNSYNQENLLESFNGDLPITRRKSLQRFLEKRKESRGRDFI
ncbi:protein TIFY 9 [Sesamum alatum]|uniref:Protein TIFY n=1 Tax=Sesamum alatum TaxID=300844 RepID=A0AAE1XLH1_9LAMI|nr:protein TIFY 9 [Sesamum alatum]